MIANGRIDEAVSILKKIAKVNGRQVDELVFDNFKVRSYALNFASGNAPLNSEGGSISAAALIVLIG